MTSIGSVSDHHRHNNMSCDIKHSLAESVSSCGGGLSDMKLEHKALKSLFQKNLRCYLSYVKENPTNGRWMANAEELTGPPADSEGLGSNTSKFEVSVSLAISGI